ncbi:zinc finger domain-containing protein [Actinoplanes regularis]|nr:hypothetical protein [Actinoplanes regularis]GLW35221.1 hypothetical protein Areg01_81570 [Actinoplanes regularis]
MQLPEFMKPALKVRCPQCGAPVTELCANIFNGRVITYRVHLTRLTKAGR